MPEKQPNNDRLHFADISDETGRDIAVYYIVPDLPSNPKKRSNCMQHISDTDAYNFIGENFCMSSELPAEDEAPEIQVQLSCKGRGFFGNCNLVMQQLDADGNSFNVILVTEEE